ncbi:MAG: RIP metalloprotease RseP [Sphaerochaetaceae bacterium]
MLLLKYLIGYIGIGVVVIVHELGHFFVARLCGISVEVFSFGFGPKLWGRQSGHTEFRLSLIPFGGYCRMKGSDDLQRALETKSKTFVQTEAGSLFSVSPFRRLLTYGAGPLANFLLASLVYAVLASVPTQVLSTPAVIVTVNDYPTIFQDSDSNAALYGLKSGDLVLSFDQQPIADYQQLEGLLASASKDLHRFVVKRNESEVTVEARSDENGRWGVANSLEPIVGHVRSESAEELAGLQAGDRILSCNDRKVENNYDLLVALGKERDVTMIVVRAEKEQRISFTAASKEDGSGSFRFSLAEGRKTIPGERFSLLKGAATSFSLLRQTAATLWAVIRGYSADVRQELTGTGRAALMIGDIATLGMESDAESGLRGLWYLLGIVSVSIAVGNLIPLPAFDGGQMIIAVAEMASRRRLTPRTYWILQLVGMASVILIFLLMSYVDFKHLYLVKLKPMFYKR